MSLLVRIVLITLAVLAGVGVTVAVPGLLLVHPFLLSLILYVNLVYAAGKRRERQTMLLWHLALAVRRGRPMAPELRQFAADMPRRWRNRLESAAGAVEAGDSLPTALGIRRGLLPRWAVCSLRVGEQAGRLPETLLETARRMTRRGEDGSRETLGAALGTLLYLVGGFYIVVSIMAFVMIYIVPKFKRIFDGFGTELPAVTEWVISVGDLVADYWYVAGPLTALGIVEGGWVAYATYYGWSEIHPPFGTRITSRLDMPNIARDLATSVEGGVPIPEALGVIAGWQPHSQVNRQLSRVAADTTAGNSVWTSLRSRGFLKESEAVLLASAERLGNLPWALRELADSRERLWWYRTAVGTRLLEPAVVLGLGLVVGLLSVALFIPIVSLIHGLS